VEFHAGGCVSLPMPKGHLWEMHWWCAVLEYSEKINVGGRREGTTDGLHKKQAATGELSTLNHEAESA